MDAEGCLGDRTRIETDGYRCLVADHCTLVDRVASLTQRVTQLEFLMSEELLAGLVRPHELHEVVAELGAGWRIERRPAVPGQSEQG